MNLFKKSAVVAGALALGLTLASCSSGADAPTTDNSSSQPSTPNETTPSTPGETGGMNKLAPVIIDVMNLTDGQTFEVMEGNSIDLVVPGETGMWKADVSDPTVLEFSEGGRVGEADFNPGLRATAVGETTVTITDGFVQPLTFTVVVTPSTIPDGAVA